MRHFNLFFLGRMILSFWICHGQRRTDRILLLLQIIFSGEDDYPTEKVRQEIPCQLFFRHLILLFSGIRWQKWAIYQRLLSKDMFQYTLEDYIFQNFLRDLDKKSLHSENGAVWKVISDEYRSEQALEVRSVMKAYYSAFNRQHYDDLGSLWLPDDNNIELLIPGYSKAVS